MDDKKKPKQKNLEPQFKNHDDRAAAAERRLNEFKAELKAKKLTFSPHLKARSRATAMIFRKPSKTARSQAYECDINNMVKGLTPFTQAKRPGFYIDDTVLPQNYEEQFNAVLEAQEAFMLLPPDVREQFHNDPAKLARALSDPSQHEALRALGILPPLPTPQTAPPSAPEAVPASSEAS